MSELSMALELLKTASTRTSTVVASVEHWSYPARSYAIARNYINRLNRRGSQRDSPQEQGHGPEDGADERVLGRVWLKRPDWIRTEWDLTDGREVLINRGAEWWLATGREVRHGMKNEGPRSHLLRLLDPAAIFQAKTLEFSGRGEVSGREVFILRVIPAPSLALYPFSFGIGASDFEVSVDANIGIVLRSVARLQGEPFESIALRDVTIDSVLDDNLFSYVARPDETVPDVRSVR